jgi:hypothetical protein
MYDIDLVGRILGEIVSRTRFSYCLHTRHVWIALLRLLKARTTLAVNVQLFSKLRVREKCMSDINTRNLSRLRTLVSQVRAELFS